MSLEHIKPMPCICGQVPAVAKAAGRGYIIGCVSPACRLNGQTVCATKKGDALEKWQDHVLKQAKTGEEKNGKSRKRN